MALFFYFYRTVVKKKIKKIGLPKSVSLSSQLINKYPNFTNQFSKFDKIHHVV